MVEVIEVKLDKVNPLLSPVQVSAHSELNDKVVVLVDDVLKSGKTLMYGAQYFLNQPIKKLMTAILIDRNYKTYPIKADVVGLSLGDNITRTRYCRFRQKRSGIFKLNRLYHLSVRNVIF